MLPFSGQFSKGFGDKCPYKTSPNSLQIRNLPEVNSTLTIYIGRKFWYNDWTLAMKALTIHQVSILLFRRNFYFLSRLNLHNRTYAETCFRPFLDLFIFLKMTHS